MYYIYMLRCSDNSLYTGITKDMEKRMKEHCYKLKQGAKYTKVHDVTSLEALWCCDSKGEALKLEYYIKQLKKVQKEALIQNPGLLDKEGYTYCREITLAEYLK